MNYIDGGETLESAPAGITTVLIVSKVKKIYGASEFQYAFEKCKTTLQSFTFESNPQLETIGNYSFFKCTNLLKIDLSECKKLTTIQSNAFNGCSSVTSITFPGSLSVIGENCFVQTLITTLSIPSSVTIIEGGAFYLSSKLESITIPTDSKIKQFNYGIFRGSKIQTFFIPQSVVSFSPSCLEDTKSLTKIDVDVNNKNYESVEGVLITKDGKELLKYPSNKGKEYTVPSGIETLCGTAFNWAYLDTVTISDTVKTISSYCFLRAYIKNIVIPDSVTVIGTCAFSRCGQLTSVQLSNNITNIGPNCFEYCDIRTITIPEGVTDIGSGCFKENKNLGEVILPTTLNYLGGGAFNKCPNVDIKFSDESNLYIDNQFLIMDKMNTSIKQLISSEEDLTITIPSTVKNIETEAFSGKMNLKSLVLVGSQLEIIYNSAFYGCKNLETFEIPSTLISIGNSAFYSCNKLKSITFSDKLTSIGLYCFQDCIGLEEVILTNSKLSIIRTGCFKGCTALTTVSFPETTLEEIEEYAFQQCSSLSQITFPASLTKIGSYAFKESGLTNAEFSSVSSMTELHVKCFSGCSLLSHFVYPENVKIIGNYAFEGCSFETITLPNSVEKLNMGAYSSNAKLVNFTIQVGSQLNYIGTSVFEYDFSLNAFYCKSNLFVVETGALLNENRSRIIAFPPSSPIYYLQIPPYVKQIGDSAFSNCKNLRTVSIADNSVNEICLRSFINCTNLSFINLPSCVTAIGSDAFKGCSSLTCGIPIDISANLVKTLVEAGMPRKALYDCKYCYTKEFLRREHYNNIAFALLCMFVIN